MTKMIDFHYRYLLHDILLLGDDITTRNSAVKRRLNLRYCTRSTPLISLRRTAWKSALLEMEWFLSGSDNIDDLDPKVHSWWKPWADEGGRVLNNYSSQFYDFHGAEGRVNQIDLLISGIRNHPLSRRNVITTWNTADMVSPNTPITNCHGTVIQSFCDNDGNLDLTMYQRSADMVVGVPHNWIQYWAFLLWLAHRTGKQARSFNWIGGDCHIYKDHFDLAQRIIDLDLPYTPPPDLIYTPSSENFKASDFSLSGEYDPIIKESASLIV